MTIAEHLLAIAEELERLGEYEEIPWLDALYYGFRQNRYVDAFRRAAELAEKEEK